VISERDAWAVMASVPGLGPTTFGWLLREHGSALRVLDLARTEAGRRAIRDGPADGEVDGHRRTRLRSALIDGLTAVAGDPEAIVAGIRADGLRVVTVEDEPYPGRLRALEEPPPVLFVRGSVEALAARHAVAIVGTRRPTEAGRRVAARLADAIARADAVVVSGLAVGIDGAAHAAAVSAGRPTVAVLGSGHRRLFPRAHGRLAEAIVAGGGAVVSELPPDVEATRGTFPRRNRVISGLAEATVVVEAAAGSGALITARWALEQGRGCFIVPGSIDAPASTGCNGFLRDYPGLARIVAGVPELLDDLGILEAEPAADRGQVSIAALAASLGATAGRVARALVEGVTTVDELADRTDLPVATVLGALTVLEIRGLVAGAYGRYRPVAALAAAAPGLP
jgi:DNA processing protein